jgi:hypothetical protein
MQPVPAPAWRLRSARALWLALGTTVLVAAVAIAIAGHSPAPAASTKSDLQLIGGKPLQQASCEDWLTATPDERAAVIAALKRNVGGATGYGPGSTLSNADAYALFERSCARAYARGFLLYIIYSRAAAFQNAPQHFQ